MDHYNEKLMFAEKEEIIKLNRFDVKKFNLASIQNFLPFVY